ncbi:PQQ-binding-like beta-propeller repeat protein [Streptomyces lunaelactis]|uniref:serine/threonine-protein kinase n=1 Tax=Streptomyces lunaelactis TaxID=1535768 RepID=UPI0015850AE1|nr:serine/threonine-protein kinase [Streptomyces lunaelactis]NUK70397.1 PQQ-binding-like beta-propeller repeat protein [Streptomyces lunaelactis]NUK76888.1 PQQ-binding-like beta-propeller repeat protein [Streptomyces lunaelactis]
MEPLGPDDPQELGSYRLLRLLGAGGMGRVYLARSPGGRTVAVKVVRPDLAADQGFRQRFRHEVEIAKAVSGRYTAPVVDAAPDAAIPWLATAYVLGPDLTDVVATHGALPERTVRALGAGLAAALQEVHAAGLIHRDLKPSNVLLAADGPRVIDFGIARAVDGNRLTQTGVVVGSPGYMPPEQALGRDVGTEGDVFSLGAVLAFAATGRNVFGEAAPAAMLYQVVHEEPDLTGTPPRITGLIRACLAKDPAARPTPAEILQSLAPAGTSQLLADWLPSAVASTIATHASSILDLETPVQGSAPMPVQGFGPPPTALDTPTPGMPLPGTVQLGADPAPSRRRFLALTAGGGVAGVTVAGAGAAWMFTRDGNKPTGNKGSSSDKSAADRESFTTPPPGTAPQVLWHKSVSVDTISVDQRLLVHDSMLLISGDPLTAYDVKTGMPRWTRKGVAPAGSPLLLAAGKLFLVSTEFDGAVIGLDVKTGKESWRSRLSEDLTVERAIAVDDRKIFVVASVNDGKVRDGLTAVAAIDHRTGKVAWQEQRDSGTDDYDVAGTVAGNRFVYTDSNFNLTARDTGTGKQLWSHKIGDDLEWTPALHDGLVLIPGDTLTAVDVETGKTRWTLSPSGRRGFKEPMVVDGVLYAADYDQGVWAVDLKQGKKIWLCEEPGARRAPTEFVRVDDTLYGASYDDAGGVFALDLKTGRSRWTYNDNTGNLEQWHIATSGKRLLATHGGEIYALPAV